MFCLSCMSIPEHKGDAVSGLNIFFVIGGAITVLGFILMIWWRHRDRRETLAPEGDTSHVRAPYAVQSAAPELPNRNPNFTGREDALEAMHAALV